jgi:hypothetical protein
MITQENLKFCFDDLTQEEVINTFDTNSDCDYVLFELNITNVGGYSTITPAHYNEEMETEANDSGQLFCDKDDFLQMFVESGSTNESLIELI